MAPGHEALEGLPAPNRVAIIAGDMIACRTCFGLIYIPATTILRLLRGPAEGAEFASPTQAVFAWLFNTILTSVNGGMEGMP